MREGGDKIGAEVIVHGRERGGLIKFLLGYVEEVQDGWMVDVKYYNWP